MLDEAAKIGLYSLDFYGQQYFEESGLGIPIAVEELFWGDAGIGLSLVGSSLAAVAVVERDAGADRRVVPADVRRRERRQAGRVLL